MQSNPKYDEKSYESVAMMDSKDCIDDEGEKNENKRGHWASQLEYLLSVVGFCVALGNVWRFPYICNRNGGGAFLIPFLVCLVLCGLPLFFLEMSLGQFSAMSPTHVWSLCPLLKGIGLSMMIMCFSCVVYLTVICAWALYYTIYSCRTTLPWTDCNNIWNTDACVTSVKALNQRLTDAFNSTNVNGTGLVNMTSGFNSAYTSVAAAHSNGTHFDDNRWNNDSLSHTAAEEFWQYKALGISSGINYLGPIKWELALCLLASWVIIFVCVVRGVRSVGKAVYVTATVPYVILIVLLIRGLTLPGGTEGALFYITPNFSKLLEIQVWLEACLQVFYSLGPAWGCIITMASYTKFNTNCLRNAVFCTFVCEGTSLFAGLVVFSILGFMAKEANVPIEDVVSSGPGLGFVIYPEALSQLPLPQLWSVLFFIMLILLSLDSLFSMVETVVTAILDEYPKLIRWRVLLNGVYCIVSFLLGLVMTTEGGVYVFQLLDWYIVAIFLIFSGLLECVIVAWIYGIDRFSDDIELMIGRPAPLFFKITWCYITPAMLLTTLIFTFTQYEPPTYGKYVYPYHTNVIGWIIAAIPLIPVVVMIVVAIYKQKGSLWERVKMSLVPDATWGPADQSYRAHYLEKHRKPSTLKSAFKSSVSCT
ncbi:sodium- and chloride-dependent glycine transporter 2-like [Haliotis rufescens]|uniref:sodium- and chloride-dependent glycine transporter 2-like n=1 Tax=Haliotis rufescens TaxID=6454 RepID=UPI00201E8313|nr:sodium- and chloride-dependent glycine transporter 2-like [Haliotis rufescens]XP_046332792.2 sodium- and chloride-dependent glycine transporter 2-like [Haliotis rufescens]